MLVGPQTSAARSARETTADIVPIDFVCATGSSFWQLAAPVMRYPDRGVTLVQQPDRSVLALISGERDIEARLGACLPGPFPLPRRATTHFSRLATTDGAPLIGRLRPSKLLILAGLGDAAAFFAPPIARLLAGMPKEAEKTWFSAHDPALAYPGPPAAYSVFCRPNLSINS